MQSTSGNKTIEVSDEVLATISERALKGETYSQTIGRIIRAHQQTRPPARTIVNLTKEDERKFTARVGPSVRIQLRERYREIWGRDWPEHDEYLSQLWVEGKEDLGVGTYPGKRLEEVYEHVLDLMRENHEFDPNETKT